MSRRESVVKVAKQSRCAYTRRASENLVNFYRISNNSVADTKWEFKPGFLLTSVRAISARINQNFDGWPSQELKKAYHTFVGKPVFVNHQNFDPDLARGKVIAARYVEAGKDKYIECIMEVDARRFPRLAREIKTGGLDSVSMGVECAFTRCSYCNHKAYDEPDFCDHVRFHKGQILKKTNKKTGKKEEVLVYEKCFKLGFFELSYVFDPADETSVVSRVISAAAPVDTPDEIVEGVMPDGMMPTARRKKSNPEHLMTPIKHSLHDDPDEGEDGPTLHHVMSRRRYAYGEIEAPNQVDTLRDDDDDDTDDFHHYVETPKELRAPDLTKARSFDRQQENAGLDNDRRAEDVEDFSADNDDPITSDIIDEILKRLKKTKKSTHARNSMGISHARHKKYDKEAKMARRRSRRYYANDDLGGDPHGDIGGDDDVLQQAIGDLEDAEHDDSDDYSDDPGSDAGDTDDDYDDDSGDDDDDSGLPPMPKGARRYYYAADDDDDDPDYDDVDDDDDDNPDDDDDDDDDQRPPWLDDDDDDDEDDDDEDDDDDDDAPSAPITARRYSGRGSMSGRAYVASRRRFADTDGGPYHLDDNDQGEQEDEFISQTPGSEAAAVPTSGSGTISNSGDRNKSARKRAQLALKRRLDEAYRAGVKDARRRMAVEMGEVTNPTLRDPAANDLRGDDFQAVDLSHESPAPHDAGSSHEASRAYFAAFDNWLSQISGRTASQHGNPNFIRRSAARYCKESGVQVENLFPTLGYVLREARRTEQRSAMRKRASDSMEVAAPQDRIDVESPVSDTTDARAQASQFDLNEFGHNAGDNLADPVESSDSQIWAPGERPKKASKRADGITAVRYAEAFIQAGLAPNTPEEKWRIAGLAQTMRHGTIVDRTRLLDEVNRTRLNNSRTAKVRNALPRGVGRSTTTRTAGVSDVSTDMALFFKG